MKIISKESEIAHCQKILTDNLEKNLTKCLHKKIKVPFKKVDKAIHNGHLWFAFKDTFPNRYWNAFGLITSYREEKVVAEINSPRNGINRRTGGVFAEDDNKKRYILQRGKFIRGQHIPKKEVFKWWGKNDYGICELDDGQENKVILISSLEDGSSLVDNITLFVERVHDFKENYA